MALGLKMQPDAKKAKQESVRGVALRLGDGSRAATKATLQWFTESSHHLARASDPSQISSPALHW